MSSTEKRAPMTDHIDALAQKAAREIHSKLLLAGGVRFYWDDSYTKELTPIIAAAIREGVEEAETEKDMKRHRAGHPDETAPELSCYICREKIRAEFPSAPAWRNWRRSGIGGGRPATIESPQNNSPPPNLASSCWRGR